MYKCTNHNASKQFYQPNALFILSDKAEDEFWTEGKKMKEWVFINLACNYLNFQFYYNISRELTTLKIKPILVT